MKHPLCIFYVDLQGVTSVVTAAGLKVPVLECYVLLQQQERFCPLHGCRLAMVCWA